MVRQTSSAVPWDRFLSLGERPRPLGLALVLRVLLGGPRLAGGLLFCTFSSLFVWAFGAPDLVVDLLRPDGPSTPARVEVLAVEEAHLEINKMAVLRHRLRATDGDRVVLGEGFSTGDGYNVGSIIDGGITASGRVVAGDLRTTKLPVGGIFIMLMLMPLGGLAVALSGLRLRLRSLRLLRTGWPARARLQGTTATNIQVNDDMVYRYHFTFHDKRGVAHDISHTADDASAITDEAEEPVLYDEAHPDQAVLLGTLPGNPRVNEDGTVTVSNIAGLPLMLLVAPAAFVASTVLGWMWTR
jgi:hypothetical protein